MSSTKLYTPIIPPIPPTDETRPKPLEGVHEEKRLQVLAHFTAEDYKLPNVEKDPKLMEMEKFWLTNDCMLRYLRATKWDVPAAIKRLESTLAWRRSFGFYDSLTPEHVEIEGQTGKEVIFGYDQGNRPGLYMFPSRQNTEESERQIQYATFMIERTIDLAPPGIENIALFVNYGDKSPKSPSLSTSRNFLSILQNHYPERLGRAYIINIPFLLNAFFKVIMPLVDPVTRDKVRFNPKVIDEGLIDKEILLNAQGWGGNADFEYEHDKYWPALIEICKKRREEQMARWHELGGKIGADEWILKGGPIVVAHPQTGDASNEAVTKDETHQTGSIAA
ncbi:CRAL-TRIO domain-containing protein C23B6.04c [Serendipita indica DSM 11827]|uniref:Related to PDR16-involved in lipid biosynthesis and multidrug resistance n=1 Tax=Serendipita indica (strain DSM 11827) TaxID=1109443 RepID=G4T6V6_SERID|nr:CRAL-TRIO domain-containing protein C23B6.04c [Serendipita indica DSM 11827]CCA67049.1 related to PDR16-involved in lipid biosynthesis and multidrug resistance [Serendipita indica DSM 11827]